MKTESTFSIVIVNYNYAQYIEQAISSALDQNYPSELFEVIVVDDGSTDNSRDVIAKISSSNKNLRIIHQPNLGQAAAFYAGVNAAKHAWICLLDSDDYFHSDKLSIIDSYLRNSEGECDFICHDVDTVDELEGTIQSWFERQKISGEYLTIDNAKNGYPFANPCGQIYRKRILESLESCIKLDDWKRGADNVLVWGALILCGRVYYINDSLAAYRIHADNFFMGSTKKGLVPKIQWQDRWPRLLEFLKHLSQVLATQSREVKSVNDLIGRLEKSVDLSKRKTIKQHNMSYISLITTCKNRLEHLKVSLPEMLKLPNADVIVVNYGCQQGTSEWVKSNYPQVKLVEVNDDDGWNASRARNLGAELAKSEWLLFIDADAVLNNDIVGWLKKQTDYASLYLPAPRKTNLFGTCIIKAELFKRLGGYDEAFRGWGGEDTDLYDRVVLENLKIKGYPSQFVDVIEHGDELRAFGNQHDQLNTMNTALRVEMLYRTIKTDIKKICGKDIDLSLRVKIMQHIKGSVKKYEETNLKEHAQIKIVINDGLSMYQKINFNRTLIYSLINLEHKVN